MGRAGHTLVSYLTVWLCLSCLTAEGNKLLIFLHLSVSLPFCHFLFFFSCLSQTFVFILNSPVSSSSSFHQRLLLSVLLPLDSCGPLADLWVNCLTISAPSYLMLSQWASGGKMSNPLQLSWQKCRKLLPAVPSSDGPQECNFCSSDF